MNFTSMTTKLVLRLLPALLVVTTRAGAMTGEPRITSIQCDYGSIEVTVVVPFGVERVVLESCQRSDLIAWTPRAVQRVKETNTIKFVMPAASAMELFRVRADERDPLPASFYSGTTNFQGELLESGSTEWIVMASGLGFTTLNADSGTPSFSAGTGPVPALRAVNESDIWRVRDDRIYFFNAHRGLQIIDVADSETPVLRGALAVPGAGEQMYLLGEHHVILLISSRCDGGSSGFVVLVDITGDQPREVTRFPLNGRTLETRLVGTALYVATQTWAPQSVTNGVWEQGVLVSAFDFAQPEAPVARPSLALPGFGGVVTATDSQLFVTTSEAGRSWWASTLNVFDIADPTGVVHPVTAIPLRGNLKDKFKIHQSGDVLAVVTEGWSETNQTWRSELATYRLLPSEGEGQRWTQLGSVELGLRENLFATRFDGDRAYVVTYRRVDPLWVVDFSDPARPAIKGELQIPGWSTYIHPMGDRLLTVGVDDTAGRRVSVQLFDVADPAAPALRSKVVLGEGWSSSEATENEKAFGVFPDDGLVLVPFSTWRTNQYVQGVQFVDLGRNTLRARGAFENPRGVPRRTLVRGDRVLTISSRELLTVDAANRDTPTLRHTLELAYPVDRVIPIHDWLVQFSGTDVRVSAAANPGVTVRRYALDDLPVLGATAESNKIHVLQGRTAPGSYNDFWILAVNEDGARTQTNLGVLKLSTFDAARLPELTVAGAASMETTNRFWSSDAKPLWPRPGLLVWSLNGQQRSWWNPYWTPIDRVNPIAIDIMPVVGAPVFFGPLFAFDFAPVSWFYPVVLPNLLVAVDVNQVNSPRFLSETPLPSAGSPASDSFAANGLVFSSHARHESEIVSTNFYVYTNQVWVTNHVWETKIVTNAIPVYRHWTRHSLHVVDYQQSSAAAPVVREPVSLPGLLQGVSHNGAVLYTLATNSREQSASAPASTLSALAYDGVAAHLVTTLTVSTNSNEDSALVAVNTNGVVLVARDSWIAGHLRRLECWRLDEHGQLGLLGALDRSTHGDSLLLLGDLVVLRTETSFELVDLSQPTAPVTLPMSENLRCLWADLSCVRGDRESGVWLPAGELGSLLLWRR